MRRLISPAPFILKGDGWYVTDYPSEARKKGMEADKPAAKPSTSEKSGDSGSSASTSTPAASSAPSSSTSSG